MLDEDDKRKKAEQFSSGLPPFFLHEENHIYTAIDGTQILVGEIVRECLGALKRIQVQIHYI